MHRKWRSGSITHGEVPVVLAAAGVHAAKQRSSFPISPLDCQEEGTTCRPGSTSYFGSEKKKKKKTCLEAYRLADSS